MGNQFKAQFVISSIAIAEVWPSALSWWQRTIFFANRGHLFLNSVFKRCNNVDCVHNLSSRQNSLHFLWPFSPESIHWFDFFLSRVFSGWFRFRPRSWIDAKYTTDLVGSQQSRHLSCTDLLDLEFFMQYVIHSFNGDACDLSNLTHFESEAFHNHLVNFLYHIWCGDFNWTPGARFILSRGSATFKLFYSKINLTQLWSARPFTASDETVLSLLYTHFFINC